MDKSRKPGNEQGNEAVPEFHAQVHPKGAAPPEATFKPNPAGEIPADSGQADPLDMPGATSKDLYTGLGKPLQGQEGREVNRQLPGKKSMEGRAHPRGREREHTGLVGVGASLEDPVRSRGLDLPEGIERGMRGKHTADYPGAEERVPASADQVAAEH